jgi:TolB protein
MLPQSTRRFLALLPAALIGVLPAGCADGPTAPTSAPAFSTEALQNAGAPGSFVFHSDRAGNREIFAMNPGGSDPVRLTYDAASSDYYPDISSNGRYVVYTSKVGSANSDIMLLDLQAGTTTNLTNSPGSSEDWARFSPNGQQVAYHSNATGNFEINVLDLASGVSTQVTSYPGIDQWPDWSPNGKSLAIRRDMDIYVLDLATGDATRLTNLTTVDQMAVWSPNGKQLAFMSFREGYCSVFLMNADGSDQTNLTPGAAGWCSRAPAWTRNGRILFMSFRPSTSGDTEVFIMNPDGSGVTRLTSVTGEDGGPRAR